MCAILDLYGRNIAGFALGQRNNIALVFEVFEQAFQRYPDACPLSHSDRGTQYTSRAFRKRMKEVGICQSMSRPGKCLDNAPMGSTHKEVFTVGRQLYDAKVSYSYLFPVLAKFRGKINLSDKIIVYVNPLDTVAVGFVQGVNNHLFHKLTQERRIQLRWLGVLLHDFHKALDIDRLGFGDGYNFRKSSMDCFSSACSFSYPSDSFANRSTLSVPSTRSS